jgi:hypothetical protein
MVRCKGLIKAVVSASLLIFTWWLLPVQSATRNYQKWPLSYEDKLDMFAPCLVEGKLGEGGSRH